MNASRIGTRATELARHAVAMLKTLPSLNRSSIRLAVLTAFAIVGSADFAMAAGGGDEDHDPVMEAVFQGINLLIVVGLIVYFGKGPITEFFSGRRSTIQSELDEAANLLTQAEQRNSELQRRLVDLSSEIEGIREAATRRAEDEAERILADAGAAAERIRSEAQAAVDQELRRAQATLRDEAADLALEIAARKLTDNVAEGDRERLMDEFITRIEPGQTPGQGAN